MLCLKTVCSLTSISKGLLSSSTFRGSLTSSSLPTSFSSSSLVQQIQKTDFFRSFASASKSKTVAKAPTKKLATKTASKAPAKKAATKTAAKKTVQKKAAPAKKPIITSKKAPVVVVAKKVKVEKVKSAQKEKEKESMMKQKIKQQRERTKEKETAAKEKEKQKMRLAKEKQKQEEEKEKVRQVKMKERERKANAPKRCMSSFAFYMAKEIKAWKAAHPKNNFGKDIFKQISGKWGKMSDNEKKPFVSEAAKDKVRYEKEKEVVAKNAPPKRPLTPYMMYASEVRPTLVKEYPDLSFVDVASKTGKMWSGLSTNEQEKYKKAYRKASDEFKKKHSNL